MPGRITLAGREEEYLKYSGQNLFAQTHEPKTGPESPAERTVQITPTADRTG